MNRTKRRGNGASALDANLVAKQSGFRISLAAPFSQEQVFHEEKDNIHAENNKALEAEDENRINFRELLYDTFRVQRRDNPEVKADQEAEVLWKKLKSEFYTLTEDRFIVRTCLFPPYAIIDAKFRQKFAKMFHSHSTKKTSTRKNTPSLRDVAPSVEELQQRLRTLTQDPALALRLNLIKVEVGLTEDLAEKKKEREEREERHRKRQEESETPVAAVDLKKMSKAERKEHMRKKRTAEREAQAKREVEQADQMYLAINRNAEAEEKEQHQSQSPSPSPTHGRPSSRQSSPSPSSSPTANNNRSRRQQLPRKGPKPSNSQASQFDAEHAITRKLTPTQIKFLASRDALMKHSRVIQERVVNKDMEETYVDGRAVPCVVIDDTADRYKGTGNSLPLFKHVSPAVVESFLKYTNNDSVLKEERVLRQQYDALKQKEEDHVSLGENLENERTRHLNVLQQLETVHRGTMVNALTAQMEEDIRLIRENHIRAVELETRKIRDRFSQQQAQINAFYDEQRQSVFRANRKLHMLQLNEMKQELDTAVARRESILVPSFLDKILVLAEDLECPHLLEDCVELISAALSQHCLKPGLQSPFLFTGGSVRKIFTNATREDLRDFMAKYNGQPWYDFVNGCCVEYPVLRVDERVPKALNDYENTGDSSRCLVALRAIMRDHVNVIEHNNAPAQSRGASGDPGRNTSKRNAPPSRSGSRSRRGETPQEEEKTGAELQITMAVRHELVAKLVHFLSALTIHRFSAIENEQRTKAFQLKITQADTFSVTELQHLLVEYKDLLDHHRRELIRKEIDRRIQVNSDLKVELTNEVVGNYRVAHRNHEVNVMLLTPFRYVTLHTRHGFKRVFGGNQLDLSAAAGNDPTTALSSGSELRDSVGALKLPKWYFEVRVGSNDVGRGLMMVGWDVSHPVAKRAPDFSSSLPFSALLPPNTCAVTTDSEKSSSSVGFTAMVSARPSGVLWQSDGMVYYNGGFFQIGVGFGPGDVVGCAFDQVKEGFFFFKNGEVVCCKSHAEVFALPPELVRDVEQAKQPSSFDLQREIAALESNSPPFSSSPPPQNRSRKGSLRVIEEHSSSRPRSAQLVGKRTIETQTGGDTGMQGEQLNCDQLVSKYTERMFHENKSHFEDSMSPGETRDEDTGVVRAKGFDRNEGLWIDAPNVFLNGLTKPLHSLSAPTHGLFPRTLPQTLFDSLGEDVRDAFLIDVLNDPVPSVAHHETNRIFGSFLSRRRGASSSSSSSSVASSSGGSSGKPGHSRSTSSASAVRSNGVIGDVLDAKKGGFGFGSFEEAENAEDVDGTDNKSGSSGHASNSGTYVIRPCVCMFSYKRDPSAQVVLNFKGPFVHPLKSFRAVVEAIEESQ